MILRKSILAILALTLGGCGNYVAYRTPGDEIKLAEFPGSVSSRADRTVSLLPIIDQESSWLGVAKVAGTTGLCRTLYSSAGGGLTRISVYDRNGVEKAAYRHSALADAIESLDGNDVYDQYTFIDTGAAADYFECIDVGPAEKATDLIVYLRPRLSDRSPSDTASVALRIDGRTGNFVEHEFFATNSQPQTLVMQPQDNGGTLIARNPATGALIIDGQSARDASGATIILHDSTTEGEPDSDFAYAF